MPVRSSFQELLCMSVTWNVWDTEIMPGGGDNGAQLTSALQQGLGVLITLLNAPQAPSGRHLAGSAGGSSGAAAGTDPSNSCARGECRGVLAWLGLSLCHWEAPVTANGFSWHCSASGRYLTWGWQSQVLIISPRPLQYHFVLALTPLGVSHYIKPIRVKIHALVFYVTFLARQNKTTSGIVCSIYIPLHLAHSKSPS